MQDMINKTSWDLYENGWPNCTMCPKQTTVLAMHDGRSCVALRPLAKQGQQQQQQQHRRRLSFGGLECDVDIVSLLLNDCFGCL